MNRQRKMRVLHVLPTRSVKYGGPVAVVSAYVEGLERFGIESEIFPSAGIEPAAPWYFTGVPSLSTLRRQVAASDLVHIHGVWYVAAGWAAAAARSAGVRYVITAHGMLDQWSMRRSRFKKRLYYRVIERRNLQRAACVHLLNQQEYVASRETLDGSTPFLLPNGVDLRNYAALPSRIEARAELAPLAGKRVVLFLGRINAKKGLDVLLPGLAQARARCASLHLVIAGPDDGFGPELDALVQRLNLREHVTRSGLVTGAEKLRVLAAADFFALTSYQEGDSMAVKEAMACGLPAILSPACNFPEADSAGAALTVPMEITAVADAVARLGTDEAVCARMGASAKKLVTENYSWATITARLARKYGEIMGRDVTCMPCQT